MEAIKRKSLVLNILTGLPAPEPYLEVRRGYVPVVEGEMPGLLVDFLEKLLRYKREFLDERTLPVLNMIWALSYFVIENFGTQEQKEKAQRFNEKIGKGEDSKSIVLLSEQIDDLFDELEEVLHADNLYSEGTELASEHDHSINVWANKLLNSVSRAKFADGLRAMAFAILSYGIQEEDKAHSR